MSGRDIPVKNIENMLGLFLNTIPVRIQFSNNGKVLDYLEKIHNESLQGLDYQFCSLADLKNHDLIHSIVAFDNYDVEDNNYNLFKVKDIKEETNYDFTVLVENKANTKELKLIYNSQKYSAFLAHKLVETIVRILNLLPVSMQLDINGLSLISEEDSERIKDFNNTDKEICLDKNIIQLFEDQVEIKRNEIAIVSGEKTLTYMELNRKSNQLARKLRENGILPNDFVVICVERSLEMMIGIFGVLKAGAAYVPVSPKFPEERVKYIVNDCKSKVILTSSGCMDFEKKVIFLHDENAYDGDSGNLSCVNSGKDALYCIYTSGTTGQPKGVVITHEEIVNRFDWMIDKYDYNEGDIFLQKTAFTFDASVWEIFIWSITGAKIVLLKNGGEMDPAFICDEIEREKISRIHFVPSMLNAFFAFLKNNLEQVKKLKSLRTVFCSGEALNTESVDEFYGLLWKANTDVELVNQYGPTESGEVSDYVCQKGASVIPIGKPIINTQIYLLNHDRLCGIGMVGELCIAGMTLAREYKNKPQLTDKKFIRNPFGKGKLYKTGDLARWLPDGNIEYLGRIDEQVKIRGFRIELGEIVSSLKKIKNIKDCAVIVRSGSNGEKFICAYIVSNVKIDDEIIRNELGKVLPEYMIPTAFKQIESIPVTNNGKLDKRALPEIQFESNTKYEEPRNEKEKIICDIFESVLNVERVGINNNFFNLGGHSLKAILLINRIEAKLGIRMEVGDVFKYQTPARICGKIFNEKAVSYEEIPVAKEQEYYEMSSIQKRIYMDVQMDKGNTAYNIPQAIELMGELDVNKIERAINEIMNRHEIFRTEFMEKNGELLQRIRSHIDFKVHYDEKIGVSAKDIIKDFIKPFNLELAPLLRCNIVKHDENKYVLMIDMHHIISDGMSVVRFWRELSDLYNEKLVEEINHNYKDYSEWMKSRDFSEQKDYWISQFSDNNPILDIRYDFKCPRSKSFTGATITFYLNPDLSEQIMTIARKMDCTEYMIFLAMVMILLSKYSGQDDIVIGSPVSGRTHKDTEKILGVFVNTLPMRGKPNPEKTFFEFLGEIKESCIKAFENQDYPFEKLIENTANTRDMYRNPLFDVMLEFQNNEKLQIDLNGLLVKNIELDDNNSKFDMTFNIKNVNEKYAVEIRYCTDLFKRDTMEILGIYFQEMMYQIVNDGNRRLKDIHLISKEDRERILYDFNQTTVEFPRDKTIKELFENRVSLTPNNTAVIYENQSSTYDELNKKANQLARYLVKVGIHKNDFVMIMVERSIEMMIAVYGVIKAGGAYVPVSTGFPEERIKYIISDCNPKAVIINKAKFETDLPLVDLSDCSVFEGNDQNLNNTNSSDDFMYCTYTSGTTGTPKGIPVRYRSLVNLANWYKNYFHVNNDTKNVIIAPLSFDLSMRNIFGLHMGGGTVGLCGSEDIFDANKVDDFIAKNGISLINCAASAFYALLYADQDNDYERLKSLKNIYLVGEVLSFEKIKDFMKSRNCNANIVNGYGPTEDSGISTTYKVTLADDNRVSIPVGKPLDNKKIYVLNGDDLCGIGVKGEICISGVGVTDGYLNLPQLTKKKFVRDPFGSGMMFRTGDLGRWLPDGNIEFMGRLDELVKIRGYRVELSEIESVIKGIDFVKDCTVIVRKNNDNENEIYAYVVSDLKVDVSKTRSLLNKRLPEYMIPAYIGQIDRIPITNNGKLDRSLLPDIKVKTGKGYKAPLNKNQELLCQIFQRVLDCEKVGINDNFLELGGHSLKALKVVHEIEREFGVQVEVRDLFYSPTVEELTEKIQQLGEKQDDQLSKASEQPYYAMSSAQKRVYLVSQINGNSIAYNLPLVIKLTGVIDPDKVKRSFQTLINNQEILRTEFLSVNGMLVQKIRDKVYVDFNYVDSCMDEQECMRRFFQPFQLDHAPLFRVQLIRKEGYYLLLFDIHHIITDGVSIGILFNQFSRLYNGEEIKIDTYQYKDYSEWMNSRDLSRQKQYWLEQFQNRIPILDLPLDYKRPTNKSFSGSTTELTVKEGLFNAIDTLCRETETTPYMVFLSAVMILLAKYSGQDDVVVGNGISGRVHKDTENMLGMFVNTLAMRGYPAKGKKYLDFLNEIKTLCLNAYDNQEYPFEELVNDINVERSLSRNPLFDVMLVFQNMDKQTINLNGIGFEYLDYEKIATKFDMTFKVFSDVDTYQINLEYATDLFKKETASKWNRELVSILERITKKPQERIYDLQAVDVETENIIAELNQTKAFYPQGKTIVDLFEEQVLRTPDRIAICHDQLTITYEDLNRKANQLARKLREKGVKPNDFVAILAQRSLEMLVGVYGIIKAGGAYVPISSAYPEERINIMLNDCRPKAILCYRVDFKSDIPMINLAGESLWNEDGSNLEKVNKCCDRLYCTYTSGTTGKPKGIPVRHEAEVNLITWYKEKFEITQETKNTIIAPLSFDLAQRNIFSVHTSGGMLCLHGEEEIYDAIKFAEFINEKQITMLNCAASAFYALLFADQKNKYSDLRTIKKIYLVGEALSYEKLSPFMKSPNNHAEIYNGYGATEDSGVASAYLVTEGDGILPSIPIGKPLNNKQIYVMDGERLCGIGMRGEICICGIGVTEGYLNQPELSRKQFVKNPFGEGMMYRTGDLGRWLTDGNLEFLGRIDEQVKVRGYRIELGEIENALRKIEYISDTAVISKEGNNHDAVIHAYLVSDKEIHLTEIRENLMKSLPEYMVPDYIMQIDRIPVTNNGKLDRKALPDIKLHGEKEYVSPANHEEETLCRLYEEVLKTDKVGVNDGFFELGGHSLKALMLINRIEEEFGVHIGVKEIFTNPTVRGLAHVIQNMANTKYESIPTADIKEYYPMSSTQKRTYIVCQIEENGTAYNMPYVLKLNGNIDVIQIEKAVQKLIDRHEILRTEFITKNGEMLQRIVENVKADYSYFEDGETSEEELINKFVRPFDFEHAPLLRTCLVKRKQGFLLMFDTHHIVSDGMSIENFLRDFSCFYNRDQLKPLTRQYKDYSEWMRKRDLSDQKDYWVHEFEGEIPILDLPLDYIRPKEQSFNGKRIDRTIDVQLSNEIKDFAKHQGITEYMVFLAAAMILLSKYSRQEDIVIGSPISGRTHKDTENMLGMFVNTLAMRGKPEGSKTFKEFIMEIKESCLKAYENQEYPFEELVEEVKIQRNLTRNPLFDIMLVLQNTEKTDFHLNGVDIQKLPNIRDNVKFDLTFKIFDESDGYDIALEYCTDLFMQSTADWMVSHFVLILEQIIKNIDVRLNEIELIGEDERKLIENDFNHTAVNYGSDKTVIDVFEEQVAKTPDHCAVVDGNLTVSYQELNNRINRMARHLIEKGVRQGDFVAIIGQKSVEIIIGIFGALKAEAIYVPINPDYPKDRIQYILNDCNPKAVLVYEAEEPEGFQCINIAQLDMIPCDDSNLSKAITSDNLAYCIYTSGTTGKPKGVLIEHGNLYNYTMYAQDMYFDTNDCIPLFSNIAFDLTETAIYPPLVSGSSIKVYRDEVDYAELACDKDLTVLKLTPSHLKVLLENVRNKQVRNFKCMVVGGEGLPVQDSNEAMQVWGPDIKIYNEYGPTETTIGCCVHAFEPQYDKAVNVRIGTPVANTQIYIMEGNHVCGFGIPGEICIAGSGVGRGYLNLGTLTKEKFVSSPNGKANMYRSGDLGRWLPDGSIECMGRIDNQVKIRGYRVELGEIENVIKRIKSIKDAAVIVRNNDQCEKHIYAYLVSDEVIDKQEIIREIKNQLPDYMIPTYMAQIEKIPLTSNGKLNQRELPEILSQSNQDYEAPENEKENVLCGLFKDVLGVEQVGRYDNFYELGGDSIKAIRMVSRIREHGYKLTVRDILSKATVQAIALQMKEQKEYLVNQGEVFGDIINTPIIEDFIGRDYKKKSHYNQAKIFRIKKANEEQIRKVINAIIRHHDILRSVLNDNHLSIRKYVEDQQYDYYELDINGTDYYNQLEEFCDEIQQSMNLNEGPLVKVARITINEEMYLFVCIHHMVVDGVSWRILVEDICSALEQLNKPSIVLPLKTMAFIEWAKALQEFKLSKEIKDQIPYWNDVTEQAKECIIEPEIAEADDYDEISIECDQETTNMLSESSSAFHTKINDILLTALDRAYFDWKGREKLIVALEGHGREKINDSAEIDRTVGWFTITYPIILNYQESVSDNIIHTKEMLRKIPNNGIGYSLLDHAEIKNAILFNYMGEMDAEKQDLYNDLPIGSCSSSLNKPDYLLEMNSIITNKKLSVRIKYNKGEFREESVKEFLYKYRDHLNSVLKCCVGQKEKVYTESDWSTEDLDTDDYMKILGMLE